MSGRTTEARGDEPVSVQASLEAVEKAAEAAWPVTHVGADGLTLAEIIAALECSGAVIELVWQMVGALNTRTERIRDREITEHREGAALNVVDTALVHLSYGRETLMAAYHLLMTGRDDLLRVTDGEV